jgi:Flp pilus assembly protein TadG
MVETALVFLAFVILLIGAFDFGQFLFVHQALVERARSAARWGAVQDPIDPVAIQNMVLYNRASAPDGGTTFLGLERSMITVTNPGAGTDDRRLNVAIHGYTYTVLSPNIGGTYYGPAILVSAPLGYH